MLRRIWQKLVALNHSRDIYGEDTLVTQGIQLAVGLLTAYGILEFIGLWDVVFHREKGCLSAPEWISTHPKVPGKCRSL